MPYELNVALVDLLGGPAPLVGAHLAMIAMVGVPAVYIHSFLATSNDHEAVAARGHDRAINRGRICYGQIQDALADAESPTARVLPTLVDALRIRRQHRAFAPNAAQAVLDAPPTVLVFTRHSPDETITVVANMSATEEPCHFAGCDLLSGAAFSGPIAPYQVVWLA